MNHPERIRVSGQYNPVVDWLYGSSMDQIIDTLNSIPQIAGSSRIAPQLSFIIDDLPKTRGSNMSVNAIIFVTDTSVSALQGFEDLIQYFTEVQVTFIMMGSGLDTSRLRALSNNFIYWTDLSQPQPENWNSVDLQAFGCMLLFLF